MDKYLKKFISKFVSALKSNKLGHAYLFTGANMTVLNHFALKVLCEIESYENKINTDLLFKRLSEGNYSDLMTIDNEDKSIKINDIRKIPSFLQMRAIEGTYRIILIQKAELMTIEAQNALLKVLEEPCNNSLLIILSEKSDTFLPTVLSRVQIINLNQDSQYKAQQITFEDKEIIVNHLQKILLLGDINSIFSLSDIITSKKNRLKTEMYLNYLYAVFFEIARNKQINKVYNDENDISYQLSTKLTSHILDRILNTILDTIKQIKQNASLNLSIQTMLIKIQEDYYAENSRNTI